MNTALHTLHCLICGVWCFGSRLFTIITSFTWSQDECCFFLFACLFVFKSSLTKECSKWGVKHVTLGCFVLFGFFTLCCMPKFQWATVTYATAQVKRIQEWSTIMKVLWCPHMWARRAIVVNVLSALFWMRQTIKTLRSKISTQGAAIGLNSDAGQSNSGCWHHSLGHSPWEVEY